MKQLASDWAPFGRNWIKCIVSAMTVFIFTLTVIDPALAQPRAGGPPVSAADLFGLIEVGGSGVKPSVVRLNETTDGDLELIVVADLPSLEVNAVFDTNIDRVAAAVGSSVDSLDAVIRAQTGGQPSIPLNILVLGSSGIATTAHSAALRERVNAVIGARASAMTYISAQDETTLTFDGIVNCARLAHRRPQVLLLDIGSSNTKGAYLAAGRAAACGAEGHEHFAWDFGVKRMTGAVEAGRGEVSFQDAAVSYRNTVIRPALETSIAAGQRGLTNLPRVYLSGGIIWTLATVARPADGRRYVELSASDITNFRLQLRDDPSCITDLEKVLRADPECDYLDVDFSRVADPARRQQVIADHDRIMRSVYEQRDLISGAEILVTLSDRLAFADRTLFYAAPARRAWLLGYVLRERGMELDRRGQVFVPPN